MGDSVDVRRTELLGELEHELFLLASEAEEAYEVVQAVLRRTRDNLEQERIFWHGEVARRSRGIGAPWSPPGAVPMHDTGDIQLAAVYRRLRELEDAEVAYRVHGERLHRLADVEIPRARRLLARKIADLERYLAIVPGTSSTMALGVGMLDGSSGHATPDLCNAPRARSHRGASARCPSARPPEGSACTPGEGDENCLE